MGLVKRSLLGLFLVSSIAASTVGCGGGAISVAPRYDVAVDRSPVSTGGTANVEATVVDGGAQSYAFTVREGAAGGTLVQGSGSENTRAVYTAPATAGTYHVDVAFLTARGSTVTRSATIVVR